LKRRQWIIVATLMLAMLALSGCGVPTEGVDVTTVQPNGFWETFVVWPLANILIWLNGILLGWGIPYHWGWAIILFTLMVKLLTFPLNLTQIRGMQAQKELQPRLQELQKKFGKDRERLAQEQMKLYQEAGVNPLSGCLPLLIQMPILFGLYAALVAIGPFLINASFFWIPDLAFPSYAIGMAWIPEAWQAGDYATLVAYLILPVLLVVTQFVMQKWMTPTPTGDSSQAALTQNMTLIMTFFFGWFTLQVPAGLTLYWVTSNVLQMLQQWVVTRYFMRPSTPAVATAGAGNGGSAPVTIDGKADKSEKAEKAAVVPASTTVVAKPASASKQGKGKNKGK
jgi:YidC/Oxa1 family membrane protein insertase